MATLSVEQLAGLPDALVKKFRDTFGGWTYIDANWAVKAAHAQLHTANIAQAVLTNEHLAWYQAFLIPASKPYIFITSATNDQYLIAEASAQYRLTAALIFVECYNAQQEAQP